MNLVKVSKPPNMKWTSKGNPPLSLILVGKTGEGKSATGNTILGWKGFRTSPFPASETEYSECSEGVAGGRNVKAVDTPGVFDTRTVDMSGGEQDIILKRLKYAKDSPTCKEIIKGFSLAQSDRKDYSGIDAFVLVINLSGRYTDEDFNTYSILKLLFGESFVKHTIVVFTHLDCLGEKLSSGSFVEWLKGNPEKFLTEKLQSVLKECNWRAVGFDNNGTTIQRSKQTADLIHLIEKVKIENVNNLYSEKNIQNAKRDIEKQIEERSKPRVVTTTIIKRGRRRHHGGVIGSVGRAISKIF